MQAMRRAITLVASLISIGLCSSTLAQTPANNLGGWPNKPVRIIVPFVAGGTTDIMARAVAPELTKAFGQSFIVENRPGAGGNLGTEVVSKSAADGYTFLMATVGTHGINKALYPKLGFDPIKDFTPVAMVAGVPNVMVMNADKARALKIDTLADFVNYTRANPAKLNMASSGSGTSIHLSGEMFKTKMGIFMPHIPYRGSSPALLDLVGGNVDVMFDNLPTALPHIRSGKLKPFAVTSSTRSSAVPNVPTMQEAGKLYNFKELADFEASAWFGLVAPAGVNMNIIRAINAEVAKSLDAPDVKDKLVAQGAIPSKLTPEQFVQHIAAEHKKWELVVKTSGAKVD